MTLLQRVLPAMALISGCGTGFSIQEIERPPELADPADETVTDVEPDFDDCFEGWLGSYSNLSVDHPDVIDDPTLGVDPFDAPSDADWWDEPSFERYDPFLDFGQAWWPVDEGWNDDPAYFAVHWQGWIKAWVDTTWRVSIAASDDLWITIGDDVVYAQSGIHAYERKTVHIAVPAGTAPIDVHYAHRGSDSSGMSLRTLTGDIALCYPEFEPVEP